MARAPIKKRNDEVPEEVSLVEDVFDYDADLDINPHYLDAEFLRQPKLAAKYNKKSAEANKEAKLAEERVKTVRSRLIKEANADPSIMGMGNDVKPTDAKVEAFYRSDPDYKRLKKELIEAQYEADLFHGAAFNIRDKKDAIEGLIRLLGMEYFSAPQVPHDLPDAAEKLEKIKRTSARERIRESMKRDK
jgi:hypothetical protein